MEKIYIQTPAIKIVPSPGKPMSSPKELEILFTYVLGERNRELLVAEGLDVIPEDRRIAALMALQDLGWVDRKGFRHHEDTYKVTAEGQRIIEMRPDFRKLDIGMKEHLDALRASDSGDVDKRKAGLRKLIEVECDLGNWDSAMLRCSELRALAESTKDPEAIATAFMSQGRAERAQNHWHEALECYLRATELYREIGDRAGVCAASRSMGIIYGNLGDHPSATRCLETSVSMASAIGDREAETKAYGNLAIVYDLEGRFEESEKAGKSCLEYFQETGDFSSAAKTSLNLGILNMSREKFDVAAEYFERTISSSRKSRNRTVLGASLINAGYCHARVGALAKSAEHTQEAVEIFKEPYDSNMLALAYRNLGHIEFRKGNFDSGSTWFEKSIRLAKESGVRDTFAACCYDFGMCLVGAARNLSFARKLLQKASSVYEQLGNIGRAREAKSKLASL